MNKIKCRETILNIENPEKYLRLEKSAVRKNSY